jgi:hypothetical protein
MEQANEHGPFQIDQRSIHLVKEVAQRIFMQERETKDNVVLILRALERFLVERGKTPCFRVTVGEAR